jgi:uncharacterized membrane protein
MKWTRAYTIIYKINRIYAVSIYVFIAAISISQNLLEEEIKESYLLFVVTTSVYYSEFVFAMTHKDGTHHLKTIYNIEEEEEEGEE